MKSNNETKVQLLKEIALLTIKISELEKSKTERKQLDKALKESEEKYRAIFDATGTATLIVNEDTTIIHANEECEHVTGNIASELVGKSWTQFVYKEDLLTMLRNSKARINDPVSVPNKYEVRLINAKGEIRNTILSVGMIPNSKSSIVSMIDITERKQAEDEINLLAHSLRSINECVSITDTKDIIFFVNDSFLKTYGYTKEELIGKHISILRPKHVTLETGNKILNKTIKSGWSGEIINQKKDGTVFPVYLSTSVIKDDKDNPFGLIGVATDITERKQAEEALQKSEEQYKDLVEKGKIAIAVDDIDGNIVYFNNQFLNLFGYSAEEIKSKTHKIFTHSDDFEIVSKHHKQRMQGKKVPSRYEFKGIRKDGSIIYIEIDVCEILKEEGKVSGTRSYLWDITERKKTEIELEKSREELLNKNEELQAYANKIITIHKVGQQLQILKKPETLEKEIIDIMDRIVECEYGGILLREEGSDHLIPFAISDKGKGHTFPELEKDIMKLHTCKVGDGIVGWVAKHGKSILLGDVKQDSRYSSLRDNIHSELCVPLKVNEKIIGVINVETPKPKAFTKIDQLVLETIAAQIAIAIQNSSMYKQVKEYTLELEQQINEKQQAMAALQDSEKELNAIFNGVKNGIVLLDKTGRIIRINKYVVEVGGFSEKKIVGKRFGVLKMFTPKSTAKMLFNFSKIPKDKDIPPYEVEAYTKKGEKKFIQIHYSFLKKEGKVEGVIAILRDITERKWADNELKEKMNELEIFYRATLDREGRVIELKQEVNKLLEQIGKKKKYGNYNKSLKVK